MLSLRYPPLPFHVHQDEVEGLLLEHLGRGRQGDRRRHLKPLYLENSVAKL